MVGAEGGRKPPWGAQASRASGEVGSLPEPDPITNTLRLFSLYILILNNNNYYK